MALDTAIAMDGIIRKHVTDQEKPIIDWLQNPT
jgi:hypothetical protein